MTQIASFVTYPQTLRSDGTVSELNYENVVRMFEPNADLLFLTSYYYMLTGKAHIDPGDPTFPGDPARYRCKPPHAPCWRCTTTPHCANSVMPIAHAPQPIGLLRTPTLAIDALPSGQRHIVGLAHGKGPVPIFDPTAATDLTAALDAYCLELGSDVDTVFHCYEISVAPAPLAELASKVIAVPVRPPPPVVLGHTVYGFSPIG